MIHNDVAYWRHLQSLSQGDPDLPSPRVCRLLQRTFERWKGRPGWLTEDQVGHLFRDRTDGSVGDAAAIEHKAVVVRKALAIERMLRLVLDPDVARTAGSCSVLADELIIGTMPPFSVGQGKEFVRYLTREEELAGALDFLNELSPMGHIVPDHGVVLRRGMGAMAAQSRQDAANSADGRTKAFYEAAAISLDAVIAYAEAHARLAREAAAGLAKGDTNRASLVRVAECLEHSPRHPARTFHEALQAIYIVHCALHWTVEIVPIGRLDQLLDPFYTADLKAKQITRELAQELIDCFWIKLDERVILDFRHAENRFTASDGVLTGFFGSSNFDQGALLNQWMQQITIGGLIANDARLPEDACNDVTLMCLAAARRLPLNSPTLDLRVHAKTPRSVLDAAAGALLSGGAHPVMLNDDIIVEALARHTGAPIPLADARDYACDGCYETMVAGQSEFSFGFVSALDLIEKALNRGAGLAASGSTHLRGFKESYRTKGAADIADFAEFTAILREHMTLACHRYLKNLTTFYGNKAAIAPSPLLSCLITGCLETGRDLTEGGARYHIFSPLLVGVSNAADSLYVIRELVFGKTPKFTLPELVTCLATDWGHRLLRSNGREVAAFGPNLSAARINEIRQECLAQPKFGSGNISVDELAWWLLDTFALCVEAVHQDPVQAAGLQRLTREFGDPKRGFELHLAPGVGTFEQYVFSGSFNGASPDGRRSGDSIASDLSPAPIPSDLPATHVHGDTVEHARQFRLADSLRSYQSPVMKRFGDGAPVDYNLPEDFDRDRLISMLQSFANGEGGSICTFTVADPATFAAAQQNPERYNLVRIRMGGWTEFFITLFPNHQEQHKRRPLYV